MWTECGPSGPPSGRRPPPPLCVSGRGGEVGDVHTHNPTLPPRGVVDAETVRVCGAPLCIGGVLGRARCVSVEGHVRACLGLWKGRQRESSLRGWGSGVACVTGALSMCGGAGRRTAVHPISGLCDLPPPHPPPFPSAVSRGSALSVNEMSVTPGCVCRGGGGRSERAGAFASEGRDATSQGAVGSEGRGRATWRPGGNGNSPWPSTAPPRSPLRGLGTRSSTGQAGEKWGAGGAPATGPHDGVPRPSARGRRGPRDWAQPRHTASAGLGGG